MTCGNQKPSKHIAPEYIRTLGDAAYEFGASFGIKLDEWQQYVMNDWLALDEKGKWACSTCGLSVPRQNGKTALVKVRVMLGIFSLGETILFTCHEVRTSRQVFEALTDILNPNGEYPELAAQVQYIKRSNGYEEIKALDWFDGQDWHKGGKIMFSSRSKGAARGFTADVVVADEAMYMTDEQVAALVPTMASASGGDMQFIMLGTPPSPGDNGTVFQATRNAAIAGEKGISWCEWGADEIGNVHDWERIERYNPSLGNRLMRKAVESELAVMSKDTFARERLGWWSSVQEYTHPISQTDWEACFTTQPAQSRELVYAVKFSHDGLIGTLAVGVKGEPVHVEIVESSTMTSGLSWLVDWLVDRKDKPNYIIIDGQSHADDLYARLIKSGVKRKRIINAKTRDLIAATSSFCNAVRERSVTHYIDDALDAAATKCVKRRIGTDGGFGFSSVEGADETLIEAVCLAYWGTSLKSRTNRQTGVSF